MVLDTDGLVAELARGDKRETLRLDLVIHTAACSILSKMRVFCGEGTAVLR